MKTWPIWMNSCQFPKNRRRYQNLAVGILVSWILTVITLPTLAQSQTDIPSYWQYSASGRIVNVLASDIDLNGVDDFITSDENGRVEMIDAAGTPQWRYVAPGTITSVAAMNVTGPADSPLEVLIGVPNQLILLSSTGEEIWRTRVAPLVVLPSSPPGIPPETAGEWIEPQEFLPVVISPFDR